MKIHLFATTRHSLFLRALLLCTSLAMVSCGGSAEDQDTAPPSSPEVARQTCSTTSNHHDGDTFRCGTDQGLFTVRLASIDAPELGQAYAQASRNLLMTLTPAGTSVSCYTTDPYGRRVCRVYSPTGTHVQASLLRTGLAWYNRAYAFEQSGQERQEFEALETAAAREHRGLWADLAPMAPWDCRAAKKAGKSCY